MADLVDRFRNRALGTKPVAPRAPGSTQKQPQTPATEQTAPATTSEAPAAQSARRTTLKDEVVVSTITLPSIGQEFTFSDYSSIANAYINSRTEVYAWDFILRVQKMLKEIGYSLSIYDMDVKKMPSLEDLTRNTTAQAELGRAASSFARDVREAMAAEQKKAAGEGKKVAGFEARYKFGESIKHFLFNAMNQLGASALADAHGTGTPFTFRPENNRDRFALGNKPENVRAFLAAIWDIAQKMPGSSISDIKPVTKEITPKRGRKENDVLVEMSVIVREHPDVFSKIINRTE